MTSIKRALPLLALLAAFVWSAATIALRRSEEAPQGTTVLRIGHWQLESGVRDAFEKLGRDFAALPAVQKKYGRVLIVQDAIPDSTYGQWLTSQMMGQTAPDLLEVGMLPDPIMLAYQSRYFQPLTALATAPNPFNRGTPMEGVSLKETFLDGMRSGYQEELQAYMRVPLSRFTSRVFYNRTLLRQLTGLDEPPHDLHAFLAVCDTIRQKPLPAPAGGQHYIPIASSGWHSPHWFSNIAEPLTYANLFAADFTRDGSVGSDETFAGVASGRLSLTDPPWRARFDLTRRLIERFNPGFVGVGRDEALFLFAQQKAVFISTGIWDVGSLQAQAEGKFDVGIADFPRPAPTDPDYGRLAVGPLYDPAGAAFPFGIYRLAKHPDLAQDFLLYLASVRGNEELNRIIGWIPSVAGVPIPPALARFAPVDQGIYPAGNLTLGGNTVVAFNKTFSEFQANPDYSFDQFARDFLAVYTSRGRADWEEQQRDWRRGLLNNEKFLAGLRGEALLDAPSPAQVNTDDRWIKYRAFTAIRQVLPEIDHRRQERLIRQGPDRPVAPYDYLPEAIENAKRRLTTPPTAPASAPAASAGEGRS
jgi:raffinose/stachyose/melibiose transport system substrate-binding protein